MLNFIKHPIALTVFAGVLLIILYLANTGRFFGSFVNKIFPCTQETGTSFPCYGWIDSIIMTIAAALFIACISLFVIKLFKP